MQCLSVDNEQLIASLIGVLLHGRSPSAVVRAITTRIVDAIKRMAVRARAHVLGKVSWIMPPSTDLNPSPAIQIKIFIAFVVASSHHAIPGFVERVASHAMFNNDWREWLGQAST
jgi:hypothetical protein